MSPKAKAEAAARLTVAADVRGGLEPHEVVERARELGLLGWVREEGDGEILIHAEGDRHALDALIGRLGLDTGEDGEGVARGKAEGHEQFAIRGVPAGRFELLRDHAGRFELRLEVAAGVRVWALPKGPSMDPASKRMAFAIDSPDGPASGAEIWDSGTYEQGGRVAWPEAIERGHAVFVLHGERLRGGFALQRIRSGPRPQWLLIKRRDDQARPGSDVVAESI